MEIHFIGFIMVEGIVAKINNKFQCNFKFGKLVAKYSQEFEDSFAF